MHNEKPEMDLDRPHRTQTHGITQRNHRLNTSEFEKKSRPTEETQGSEITTTIGYPWSI